MVLIGRDDLLRALKRFKGIAKQDLLPNNLNPQTEFWKTHAEARRETYAKLIDLVESSGIENACVFALSEYQNLPSPTEENLDPSTKGHTQALEMFFNVIGIAVEQLHQMKNGHDDFRQLLNFTPQFQEEYSSQSLAN